jgi:Cys-tRNA(Pro)/Cys-tRNA(Cys) deacylase
MTPAVNEVRRARIEHRVLAYEHDPAAEAYGTEAATVLGLDPPRVFKTLVAVVDGRPVVGLVPVTGRLDLKALARTAGGKRADLADPADAERWTGYVVGGISPFGQRRRLPTYADVTILDGELVWVSAGRRGLELELRSQDLLSALGATTAPLAG